MNRIALTVGRERRGEGRTANRYRSSSIIVGLCFLFLFPLMPTPAVGQTTISTIEGTIKDAQGHVVSGAQVSVKSAALGIERTGTSDANGFYRVTALPAGNYSMTISHTGFATRTFDNVELTVNRTLTIDIPLEVGAVQGQVDVIDYAQMLNPTASSTGATITPQQIKEMPTNGRNYLDLMQLVPGVVVNRQANTGSDNSTPVLGERAGNNNFLIDGQPNKDSVSGGAASQFNQETIAEFQVLTAGFRAEFGQASGAIVNVITRSGGNEYHGLASVFFRNNVFDTSNSLDPTLTDAPFLQRWDYSLAMGGPIVKDKFFFFGSGERIRENRRLNFVFPPGTPQVARNFETQFDNPSRTFDTRGFLKFDQQLGRHSLTQSVNYTNGNVREFLPLSNATDLPSRRNDTGARHLLLGFSDTVLVGDNANPWVITLRGSYRGDTSETRPAHPEAGVGTTFQMFSSFNTGGLFGDLGSFAFGNSLTRTALDQKYASAAANVTKLIGDHNIKFGWNFLRTRVDGVEAQVQNLQLFATVPDFTAFGPVNAGFFTVTTAGGLTPQANEIHLRNNYNAFYFQDDWKFHQKLTLNLGMRWDYDSEFKTKENISPRVGFAWNAASKTVIRGHYGLFFDQFRLGLVRNVPTFGGADRRVVQPFSYPRGFHGVPSLAPAAINASLFPGGLCVSPNLTDAQIAAGNVACPFSAGLFIGIDRLNRVVAAGRNPIPANSVLNIANIQALSGLTPDQYLLQASAAVGKAPGFFFWGPFGALSHAAIPAQLFPTDIDRTFQTPFTTALGIGIQQEIKNFVIEIDYYHRLMKNMLGVREANISFASRASSRQYLAPFTAGPIQTFGPWYEGSYDGLIISFNRRFARRFTLSGNYAYADQTDNQLGINTLPSDSFVGIAPLVTETGTGRTNEHSSFVRANGRFVAKAGTFVNGPDLDKGPSDLSVKHTFQLNGLMELPWQFQISGIFRSQSGFHFSRQALALEDPDGNGTFNTIDHGPGAGRNAFTAPAFANLDIRFAKKFNLTERVKLQALFEFFNLFNRQNPAAVQAQQNIVGSPFNSLRQTLPGREGQVGLRLEF